MYSIGRGTGRKGTAGNSLAYYAPYAWWNSLDSSTLTLTGNDVDEWADKSGNGRDLVYNASYTKPTTNGATAADKLNNKNSVNCENGWLAVSFGETIAQPYTIVAAFKARSTTVSQANFTDGNASGANRATIYKRDNANGNYLSIFAGSTAESTYTVSAGDEFIVIAEFNAASTIFFVNGTRFTGSSVGAGGLSGFNIGYKWDHAAPGNANFGDIAIFDRALTGDERDAIALILNTEWAIY